MPLVWPLSAKSQFEHISYIVQLWMLVPLTLCFLAPPKKKTPTISATRSRPAAALCRVRGGASVARPSIVVVVGRRRRNAAATTATVCRHGSASIISACVRRAGDGLQRAAAADGHRVVTATRVREWRRRRRRRRTECHTRCHSLRNASVSAVVGQIRIRSGGTAIEDRLRLSLSDSDICVAFVHSVIYCTVDPWKHGQLKMYMYLFISQFKLLCTKYNNFRN